MEVIGLIGRRWDSRFIMKDGILYRRWESPDGSSTKLQLIALKPMRTKILHCLHNHRTAGHFVLGKTIERVKQTLLASMPHRSETLVLTVPSVFRKKGTYQAPEIPFGKVYC